MNCSEIEELIHAYSDGELDLIRSLEIEQHLRTCAACSRSHQELEALRSAMRAAPLYFELPKQLQGQIHSALEKTGGEQTMRTPAKRRAAWLPWLRGAAAAALIAVIFGALAPLFSRRPADDLLAQEVVASHVRSLMPGHLTDVPSTDEHTVKPWFNGKLDFSPTVKDLAAQGFTLAGGRLDYLQGRPVAALVYQRRRHYVNVFVWPSARSTGGEERPSSRQGYNLVHWTQSGMTYWAVSDLNSGELQEFSRLLQTGGSLR
ncbi:MAG TPA: anti-sigma factor [Bryobacterales bacterium]|jgi:anti-sigma factor RsiW|nr:anti-sigma factor [Bryobacterales bacterium]